jgi:hypothetical protein
MKLQLAVPVFLLAVLVASPSVAQRISVGGKLGQTVANLKSSDPGDNLRSKGGFVAGGFLNIAITSFLSIEPQLLIVQKGARVRDDEGDITLKLDYLEAPVLGVLTLPTWGVVTPFVYAGASYGINVSAVAARVDVDGEGSRDIDADIQPTDVAVTYGGGINVDGLTLEARYSRGLDSISEDATTIRTRTILIMAGFRFPN